RGGQPDRARKEPTATLEVAAEEEEEKEGATIPVPPPPSMTVPPPPPPSDMRRTRSGVLWQRRRTRSGAQGADDHSSGGDGRGRGGGRGHGGPDLDDVAPSGSAATRSPTGVTAKHQPEEPQISVHFASFGIITWFIFILLICDFHVLIRKSVNLRSVLAI
ncbi:hypothetical protein U1Q18_008125, partial [Sarracenia purpurea var. burkii]